MPRTFLAEDLGLRPVTAAKIATMEAIIAPVREANIENEDHAPVESAALAMGFRRADLDRGDSPFEFRFTFEIDGLTVMFDEPATRVRMDVCEHVHTLEEWDHLPDDPLTTEHLEEGYQIVRVADGTAHLVKVIWEDYGSFTSLCGEVLA